MGRPFFNRSIAELEQMFEQRSGDPQFRKQLHDEFGDTILSSVRAPCEHHNLPRLLTPAALCVFISVGA